MITVSSLNSAHRLRAGIVAALAAFVACAAWSAPAAARDNGDRVIFGGAGTVREGDEVHGDLVVFGGHADVYGIVDGDAVVMGGSIYIGKTGDVRGSKVALGGTIEDESDTSAQSGKGIASPFPITNSTPMMPYRPAKPQISGMEDWQPRQVWVEMLLVIAFLCVLAFMFFPARTRMTLDHMLARPALATILGFTWPFTLAVVVVGLAITVLGIVLIPVAVVAVVVGYLVGRAAVANFLGRRFFEYSKVVEPSPLATLVLGLAIVTVLEGIAPLWVGIVLESCLSALAIGAATLTVLNRPGTAGAPQTPPPGEYMGPPPQPVFTPPVGPPPSGPPAVPQ